MGTLLSPTTIPHSKSLPHSDSLISSLLGNFDNVYKPKYLELLACDWPNRYLCHSSFEQSVPNEVSTSVYDIVRKIVKKINK